MIVESGGGARVRDEDLANLEGAISGVCQSLKMLPGGPPVVRDIRYGGNAIHLKTVTGGFWHALVEPGEDVVRDQPLGQMVDIWGDVVETTTCSFERGWIGSIKRPYMPIYSGDQIVELVETVAE